MLPAGAHRVSGALHPLEPGTDRLIPGIAPGAVAVAVRVTGDVVL